MSKSWSDEAIRHLQNWSACPRCDLEFVRDGVCDNCGADLRGQTALELAEASTAAVTALQHRQAVLDRIALVPEAAPTAGPPAPLDVAAAVASANSTVASPAVSTAATTPASTAAATPPPPGASNSQISVQSVLAVAGAGLFAIAAIVFTFFNPDLTDAGTRTTIVAVITLIFVAAAWLLARAQLQFSAEAVGALGMVFVILDIWAIATQTPWLLADYAVAAIATLAFSALFVALAAIRRMRTWLWVGLVGIAITPALLGYAVDSAWSVVLGHLGVGFAALLVHALVRLVRGRFDGRLRADQITATALQLLAVIVVIGGLGTLPFGDLRSWILGYSAVLAALAVLALLSTLTRIAAVWSALAGALITTALALLPCADVVQQAEWLVALVPAVAAGTVALLATIGRTPLAPRVHRAALLGGARVITALTVTPAALLVIAQIFSAPFRQVPALLGIASVLALLALALSLVVVGVARRAPVSFTLALAVGLAALAGLVTWDAVDDITRVALALSAGVVIAAISLVVRRRTAAPARYRRTLLIGAHVLVALGAVMTSASSTLIILGGVAAVVAIALLAVAVPRNAQAAHTGIAFAYALAITAYALVDRSVLNAPPTVIGLTATIALVVALSVTVIRAVPVRFWGAIVLVSGAPFVLSIGVLLIEISGWTGLAAGTAFVLALVMTLLHRNGIAVDVRTAAAALLVPTLAVVIISVVPQFVEQSTSPFTLPITAALVALVLPCTDLIGRALLRLGHDEPTARAVRLALEISALVTGAIAVILTLVRAATDYGTTFLVLGIIGLGAAAAGQFLRRRYAWIVAYISFTGALWALLALNEVSVLDAYVLPPALVAAIIGVVAVWRGRRGLGFYASGVGVAIAAPLLVLIAAGNGDGEIAWRAILILAAAALLLAIGGLLRLIPETSRHSRLRRLRTTTIAAGLAGTTAALVQSLRLGSGADYSVFDDPQSVMAPVLAFTAAGVALSTAAAMLLAVSPRLRETRLLLVPALVIGVLGPVSAFRHGAVYPITLLVIMVLVLVLMLVTALRAARGRTMLPPLWITFAFATVAGIAGWSEHSLFRVEPYSITLGAALLLAGIIGWRTPSEARASISSWPFGFHGSWALLAPGLVVMLGTSVMSTGTDPLTWRAILVIALALAAILLGNRLQLAAPFVVGIATLALENIVVFAVQIGETIDAATWWITLASAGAVLLVLAVSTERRASGERGVVARMRDLR